MSSVSVWGRAFILRNVEAFMGWGDRGLGFFMYMFEFLMYLQTSISGTSLKILLHITCYTFHCFFRILCSIKMKFDQVFLRLMTIISN